MLLELAGRVGSKGRRGRVAVQAGRGGAGRIGKIGQEYQGCYGDVCPVRLMTRQRIVSQSRVTLVLNKSSWKNNYTNSLLPRIAVFTKYVYGILEATQGSQQRLASPSSLRGVPDTKALNYPNGAARSSFTTAIRSSAPVGARKEPRSGWRCCQ